MEEKGQKSEATGPVDTLRHRPTKPHVKRAEEGQCGVRFACLRLLSFHQRGGGGGGEDEEASQHKKQGLCLGFVLSTSRFQTSLPHSYPCSSWWLCLEDVRGRRGGRGLDTRQSFQQTKHHHHHRSKQDLATRLIHSPHPTTTTTSTQGTPRQAAACRA